ncbi:hypothetical protein ASPZODRAFT_153666 [Penicilliopsis zonata CBS 506.65]|uniref:3-dehydroquinate dehydratase n=1 Tax=Penicilliopsis zonata CBS 506.65 TaxID=1073090 RepID=A0A1L9SCH0_9EURO|nr:hypothetical protein ASPZODRAFT_153666 [Penicilliopsis zonata CBS 506.65]OJJ44787.1 hypothetical protein ASPZODRAFT_153666 [Penicilliopsis zonata CBS 506.65]
MMQTVLQRPMAPTLLEDVPPSPLAPAVKSSLNNPPLVETTAESAHKTVVVVFGQGQENIVPLVAEVLGKPWITTSAVPPLAERNGSISLAAAAVVGVPTSELPGILDACVDRASWIVINTHRVGGGDAAPAEELTDRCDYEFLYPDSSPFFRRDLTRFLALILGQTRAHEDLKTKTRTNFISTTFPDVHAALPNLDILSVGSDAVEIRVDLLVEPSSAAAAAAAAAAATATTVPSLQYVGQQLMILRQHTELPIIFTTRCTREGGKFPMDDPDLFYRYLRRALKWGVEYLDVELWLPEPIRQRLAEVKGHTVIMSAFHDFSGHWKWTSPEAPRIFAESARYADIVKMIAMVTRMEENYELEYFRSTIKAQYRDNPPLSAVNMGQLGQLSRALNTVFSPITHPLLPMIAAPGQLTAAEINEALHIMGSLPKRELYAIGTMRATPQSMFMEKCFNELSLPHTFSPIDRGPKGSIEAVILQPNFGGAYLNPPLPSPVSSTTTTTAIPNVSEAARAIGLIDTIVVVTGSGGPRPFVGENATWKGIRATLTRDYVPSAYCGRAAIVLASTESDAAPAVFALRSLGIGPIYTVGFKANGPLSAGLEPLTSIHSVKLVDKPFVMVSALPPDKSLLVQPLLRHYSSSSINSISSSNSRMTTGRVYLDLTSGTRKGDPLGVAVSAGWTAYGIEEVHAWTTVETLRLLVGQNVPFDFVRMASGRVY